MATDLSNSFNEQYTNITNKLKKRFMRKPNVSETKNELIALAIQCEHSEQPAFAGQCYVTATKCDVALGDFLGEAETYLAAARQFMKAEMKLSSLKAISPARENLEASINCYIQASNKYPDRSPMKTSILLELAQSLNILQHTREAASYYEQALEILPPNFSLELQCMRTLIDVYIKNEQYEQALDLANKICDMDKQILTDEISAEQKLNCILLTIIVEPSEDNCQASLKQLIQDVEENDLTVENDVFGEQLRIQLKSIVMACNRKDLYSLVQIQSEIKEHLNLLQMELLNKIIEMYQDKY